MFWFYSEVFKVLKQIRIRKNITYFTFENCYVDYVQVLFFSVLGNISDIIIGNPFLTYVSKKKTQDTNNAIMTFTTIRILRGEFARSTLITMDDIYVGTIV